MKKLTLLLFLFVLLACSQKNKDQKALLTERQSTAKIVVKHQVKTIAMETVLEESFLDSTQIGVKGKSKIIVNQYRSDDSTCVEITLFEKRKTKWFVQQQLHYLKDGITNCEPEIKDFNNDGLNDLTFKSSVAARGANEIRKLLIFDKASKKSILIKNSDQYPNLQYNKTLNCVDAWLVYGGSSTVFLKIEKDSLRKFASVTLEDSAIEITVIDKKGNAKIIKKELVEDLEVYTRYDNYAPLTESNSSN